VAADKVFPPPLTNYGAHLITATKLQTRPKGTDREPSSARSAFDCTTSVELL
jgi:hypothetical protein